MNIQYAIVSWSKDMFFESDEDEEDECHVLEKIDNYAEVTVPNMNDRQFKMHFRMSPTTFEQLLILMNNCKKNEIHRGHPCLPLEKEVMIMIWCLGNIESFRSVADRFGISKSTCWDVLYRSCNLLLQVNTKYSIISWPTNDRAAKIIREFHATGFPSTIGAIDGSHIRIIAPKLNHNSYVNRKNYHSVLLQGVCESNLLFTDVYTGEVGSIHDCTLFKRSDLYKSIIRNQITFPNDSHLIGDLAYKLSETMMVGFKNFGNLTLRQKNYNLILSKSRVVIENAFGLLKGRFRRLKFLETVRLDLICLLIISACILHNICLMENDLLQDIINVEEEVNEERHNNPNNELDIIEVENNANAIVKRNNIVNALPIIIRNND